MTDEKIWNKKLLSNFEGRKIALYGVSDRSRLLLEQCPWLNIACILDGVRTDGNAYGKSIVSLEESFNMGIDSIIIAARESSVRVIYKRIVRLCKKKSIMLYDYMGENLVDKFSYINDDSSDYLKLNEEVLIHEIDKHEIISFDIFDTLIMRDTLYPDDVFNIMEYKLENEGIYTRKFATDRKNAESDIMGMNPNIHDIYNNFTRKLGVPDFLSKKIKQIELDIEKAILHKRIKMAEIFEYALIKGKKVYLISDMYLPSDIISELLYNEGISGYEKIYVSCEQKCTKYTGIYEKFCDEVKGSSYLHIGDNDEADGYNARQAGIDVFLIKSAYELMRISSYSELTELTETIDDRNVIGMLAAKIFNNPFVLYDNNGKVPLSGIEDITYSFVAPVSLALVLWIIKQMRDGYYKNILFSARDGYLIKKLYDYIIQKQGYNLPEGIYFYTSRVACSTAVVENEDDITWILGPTSLAGIEKTVSDRFIIDQNRITPRKEINEDIIIYTISNKIPLYTNSLELRKNYMTYINNIGLDNDKYAFFDLVSCGTCQYYLNRFAPMKLEGLYLGRYINNEKKKLTLPIKCMYYNYNNVEENSNIFKNYFILEYIFSAPEPSVKCFDKEGNAIFMKELRSEAVIRDIKIMQDVIMNYFLHFCNFLLTKGELNIALIDRIYGLLDGAYTKISDNYFDNLFMIDDFGGNQIKVKRK